MYLPYGYRVVWLHICTYFAYTKYLMSLTVPPCTPHKCKNCHITTLLLSPEAGSLWEINTEGLQEKINKWQMTITHFLRFYIKFEWTNVTKDISHGNETSFNAINAKFLPLAKRLAGTTYGTDPSLRTAYLKLRAKPHQRESVSQNFYIQNCMTSCNDISSVCGTSCTSSRIH